MAFPQVLPSSRVPDSDARAAAEVGHPRARLDRALVRVRAACPHPAAARRGRLADAGASRGAFAAEFGVPDGVRLVTRPGRATPTVQAVYVASPHSEHAEQALLAIEAGKHVLVEKAFTRNAKEAQQVVAAAREARRRADGGDVDPLPAALRRRPAAAGRRRSGRAGDRRRRPRPDARPRPRARGCTTRRWPVVRCSTWASTRSRSPASRSGCQTRCWPSARYTDTGVDRQVSALLSRFPDHPHAQALVNCTLAATTPTTATISGTLARIELDGPFYAPGRVRLRASRTGPASPARHRRSPVTRGWPTRPRTSPSWSPTASPSRRSCRWTRRSRSWSCWTRSVPRSRSATRGSSRNESGRMRVIMV